MKGKENEVGRLDMSLLNYKEDHETTANELDAVLKYLDELDQHIDDIDKNKHNIDKLHHDFLKLDHDIHNLNYNINHDIYQLNDDNHKHDGEKGHALMIGGDAFDKKAVDHVERRRSILHDEQVAREHAEAQAKKEAEELAE